MEQCDLVSLEVAIPGPGEPLGLLVLVYLVLN